VFAREKLVQTNWFWREDYLPFSAVSGNLLVRLIRAVMASLRPADARKANNVPADPVGTGKAPLVHSPTAARPENSFAPTAALAGVITMQPRPVEAKLAAFIASPQSSRKEMQ